MQIHMNEWSCLIPNLAIGQSSSVLSMELMSSFPEFRTWAIHLQEGWSNGIFLHVECVLPQSYNSPLNHYGSYKIIKLLGLILPRLVTIYISLHWKFNLFILPHRSPYILFSLHLITCVTSYFWGGQCTIMLDFKPNNPKVTTSICLI